MFYWWRFVVHGGVDGFSRLPVYLRCGTDNKASTVLQCFLSAINEYTGCRLGLDVTKEAKITTLHGTC